jgi:hypothetical protein
MSLSTQCKTIAYPIVIKMKKFIIPPKTKLSLDDPYDIRPYTKYDSSNLQNQ